MVDRKEFADKLRTSEIEYEIKREGLLSQIDNDIPNDLCNYAAISGFSFENSFKPKCGEINHLLSTKYEDLYIWTYAENKCSILLSKVNPQVKNEQLWKPASRLIQLALIFDNAFEFIDDPTDYKWICCSEQEIADFDDVVFYNLNYCDKTTAFECNTTTLKLTKLADIANLIELFERDDRAYSAMSMLVSAFKSNPCCLICELSENPKHNHITQEPNIWNRADQLPDIESSIMQAYKSAECILGKPDDKSDYERLFKFRNKWVNAVDIDPDEEFKKSGKTFLNYYYDLFDERDPYTHEDDCVRYDLLSEMSVKAKCFASLILRDYINKNSLDNDEAVVRLKINNDLLSRVSKTMWID